MSSRFLPSKTPSLAHATQLRKPPPPRPGQVLQTAAGPMANGQHDLGHSLLSRCSVLAPQVGSVGPVQLQAGEQPELAPEEVHQAAQLGLGGRHQRLPYLEQIQALFGPHQLGHIKAHTDDRAQAGAKQMGALAFAQGEHVAFAGPPTLHTAAHEAAHVIQQQAGVQLLGGVGQVGDLYERNADAVADAVVAGQSAAALLTPFVRTGAVGSPPVGGAVQRAVGFEFQSRMPGKNGHVFSHKKILNAEEELGPEQKLEDGFIAFENERDHWHIENDHGDIEFVTHPPFAETTEGYEALIACMTSMVAAAQRFEALGSKQAPGNRVTIEQALELFGNNVTKTEALEGREGFSQIYMSMPSASLVTHPQATGGVTLPALLTLMKKMRERTDDQGHAQAPPNREPGIREKLLAEGMDAVGMSAKSNRAFALKQQKLAEEKVAAFQPEQEISLQMRGFLALVTAMIYGGSSMGHRQVQYAKDLLAVMPRSDYVRMFASLPEQDQTWFREQLANDGLADALAWGRMSDSLIFHRMREQSQANYKDLQKVTKKSWLEAVSKANGATDPLSMKNEGIGKVSTANLDTGVQIGQSDQLVNQGRRGVVVEMRALREDVPPEQWLALTKAWFRMTVALNRPNDIDDVFPELAPRIDPKQAAKVWKQLHGKYQYRKDNPLLKRPANQNPSGD